MTAARAIWSQTLAPGKSELKRIDCDIRISLATLDEKLVNQERSSVKLIQHEIEEDEADTTTFVLANLIPGKIEAQTVDLIISDGEAIEIEITGKNTVHLSGNYIVQPDDFPDYDSESEDPDEGGFRLEDVSSDVEVHPGDLMEEDEEDKEDEGRFEEIVEEKEAPKDSGKRPAEGKPEGEGSKQKKQKKDDAKKPVAKPASDVKAQAKPASNAGGANAKPAGAPPDGQGKKHKKNKNKDKKNV